MKYTITFIGPNEVRVDFEGNLVTFFKGNAEEFKAALSNSKLVRTGKFTRTGLEYANIVAIGGNKNVTAISKDELQQELDALGI